MRDSEERYSIVGILKDKRVQLGLALSLLVVWNFWVLFDKGYVAEAVQLVLVYIVPIVVSFVVLINYLGNLFEFVSIIIVLSFGGVAVRVVSKSLHDASGRVRVWFVVPVFLLFGLFLLPVWSLYDPFCMWSGVASYVAVWIVGSIFYLSKDTKSIKSICLTNGFVVFSLLLYIIWAIGISLVLSDKLTFLFGGLALFAFLGVCIVNVLYFHQYTCDGCGYKSEKFTSNEKVLRHISNAGWKRNKKEDIFYYHDYCPVCVAKRQEKRERLKKREV